MKPLGKCAPSSAKVTVCLPVYNGARYLVEALRSVAQQTWTDFTAIVVDNASTDATSDICAAFDDPRFRYVRNDENIGSIRNHSRCIDLVTTEFAKLLSADDVLLPDTLRRQVESLDADPDLGLATCDCIVTDPALRPVGRGRYLPGRMSGAAAIAACAARIDNLIGGPSNTTLRMSAVGAHRFDTGYKWLADLEFHCRVLEASDYLNIDEPGFYYRRHGATDSVVGCPPRVRASDERAFVRRYAAGPLPYARLAARRAREALRVLLAPPRP